MMKDCEILGVPQDADQKTIKRAYFKLVKQFTPEKDPELFQKIRRAYENLSAAEKAQSGNLALEYPAGTETELDQIRELLGKEEWDKAAKLADQLIRVYGEAEAFLYFQARAWQRMGKSGKVVKAFEKLLKRYPEKLLYQKALAFAYLDRGYMNKAQDAFRKAFDEGVRDVDFLNEYCYCAAEKGQFEDVRTGAWELLREAQKNPGEYAEEGINALAALMTAGAHGQSIDWTEYETAFHAFVDEAALYLADYEDDLASIMGIIAMIFPNDKEMGGMIDRLVAQIRGILPGGGSRDLWERLGKKTAFLKWENDARFYEAVRSFGDRELREELDERTLRFMELDCKLRMLERWPQIRSEFELVRQEYPEEWKLIGPFAEALEKTKNLEWMRSKLQKDYDRLAVYVNYTPYYREYPERRPRP
ncbi:MAG: DnaJ domain-containing protein [Eubacteriales bacterium]|nr:DnaJ domain-containing protein [Eubacteriales bacterium]